MFRENPNLEKEFKKHMESTPDFMNYKMEIGKVNREVFDSKQKREIVVTQQSNVEKSNQKCNEEIQNNCGVTAATSVGNKLADRLKQRQAAAAK